MMSDSAAMELENTIIADFNINENGAVQTHLSIDNLCEIKKNGFINKRNFLNGKVHKTSAHGRKPLRIVQNGLVNSLKQEDTLNGKGEPDSYTFLEKVYERLVIRARQNIEKDRKVLQFNQPAELMKLIDFEITENGSSDEHLLNELETVCDNSVNTSHPHFFNQLFAGADEYSVAGSAVTDLMNSSAYTYEMAPVFSIQESYIFSKMRSLIGWEEGDGIFCPGGSMSNMYAINVARYYRFPEAKTKGLQGLPPVAFFTSDHSHYSFAKGAAFLGIGTDNLISVKCDDAGRMIPDELENAVLKAISEGVVPVFVNATCGTTVLGAFDPIEPIAAICERYKIWLHLDGAWGGSVLLSKKHRYLMRGSHRADSMTWNPHKMMGVAQQCSAFLIRHKDLLKRVFSANASYLFQQDKFYDVSYDTGDASLQCGRKVDVFKLWLTWKKQGDLGMERRIDRAFHNAKYLASRVRKTPGFQLVFEPECTNVGFWYIPPSLRDQEIGPDYWEKLSHVAPKIKERMMREGTTMVNYQPCAQWVNFFRMVVMNPAVTEADMDFVVAEIDRLGHDL